MERVYQFLKKYRFEVVIFLIALAVRLFFYILIRFQFGEAGFIYGDANGYLTIARNILNHRIFSLSENAPFLPDIFRTPFYSLIIAAFNIIFGKYYIFAVALFQDILGALIPLFALCLGRRIFSYRAAYGAAIFLALEPVAAFWSNLMLSETVFIFLFLFALRLFVQCLENFRMRKWLLSALLLGLATLTRPIAQFLPAIFVIFFLIFARKFSIKFLISRAVLFILVFAAAISPWAVRNKIVFNTFNLSTQGENIVCIQNLKIYLESAPRSYPATEVKELYKFFDQKYEGSKFLACRLLFNYFQRDPIGYAGVYFKRFIPYFAGSGYSTLLYHFVPSLERPAIMQFIEKHDTGFTSFLKNHYGAEAVVFWLGLSIWGLAAFFMGLGIIFGMFRRSSRFYIILFSTIILYFITFSGFNSAHSRFRQPVNALIILLAFYGLIRFFELMRRLIKKYDIARHYSKS